MDDYFAILTARVTGAADAVRPLLPSRFEPAPNLLIPEDTVSDFIESKQEITAPPPAPMSDAPQSAVHRPESSSTPRGVDKNQTSHRSQEINLSAQTVVAAGVQPSADGVPERRRQPTRAIEPKPVAARETLEAEDRAVIPRRNRTQKQSNTANNTISTPSPVETLKPKPRETSLRPATCRRSEPFDGNSPRAEESSRIGTRLTPYRAIAAGTANPAKTAPDIHISIGRIEIRATPAAAAAPVRRRTTPSTVSLEEYLARRNASS